MRSDGTEFPAELAISRVDVPGPPLFTACIRDISERTDTEERLRTAEFRYRTLVEQLPFISYVDNRGDPSSKALYVSPQIEAVLGYTPEDWLTVPDIFELAIHEDDRDRVLAEKVDAYARGATLRHEYRMHARDGRLLWVEDVSVHVEPPEGGVPFRQGFALDITERKRVDQAIRLAETRYRTLVEQLPLAVYIDRVDADSSNVYTSPQIETMLGYRGRGVGRRPVAVRVAPASRRSGTSAGRARANAVDRRAAPRRVPPVRAGRTCRLGARRGAHHRRPG